MTSKKSWDKTHKLEATSQSSRNNQRSSSIIVPQYAFIITITSIMAASTNIRRLFLYCIQKLKQSLLNNITRMIFKIIQSSQVHLRMNSNTQTSPYCQHALAKASFSQDTNQTMI